MKDLSANRCKLRTLWALAGLYIHIPYCRAACTYCNFHFSTGSAGRKEMITAIEKEYLFYNQHFHLPWDTVYFGGGTPSVLHPSEIQKLMTTISKNGGVAKNAEVTLEANPEDITETMPAEWLAAGVNRLSIGVQSLNDKTLRQMNRKHNGKQSQQAVNKALQAGFGSVNVDLIFGGFNFNAREWETTLDWAFECGADHISAYGLTVEPKTLLKKQIAKGLIPEPADDEIALAYEILYNKAKANGWDFYEISNLCKPGFRAKHNSNYWQGKPYLGIGPSAHSFDGIENRRWNISDNQKYIEQAFETGFNPTAERLTQEDRYNEWLLTSLRRTEGISKKDAESFLPGVWQKSEAHFLRWQEKEMLRWKNDKIILTLKGRLFADAITSELMI